MTVSGTDVGLLRVSGDIAGIAGSDWSADVLHGLNNVGRSLRNFASSGRSEHKMTMKTTWICSTMQHKFPWYFNL